MNWQEVLEKRINIGRLTEEQINELLNSTDITVFVYSKLQEEILIRKGILPSKPW